MKALNSYACLPQGVELPAPPPPKTRLCMAVDCPRKYRHETLIGLRFCAKHFSAFYSPDTPRFDETRG